MSGGFEFTPYGIVPIGTTESQAQALATVAAEQPIEEAPRARSPVVIKRTPAPVAPATSPRSVIKAARERVKEIRRELKRMKSLQSELAELERLLGAAKKTKPTASVRPIRSVG